VALVGGVNNNLFALTRYLRDCGFDAHFFYRRTMPHFEPPCDTHTLEYQNYCHAVAWTDGNFHRVDVPRVRHELSSFPAVIASGDEAAILHKSNIPITIYCPYGSDVYKYASLPHFYSWRQIAWTVLRKRPGLSCLRDMMAGTKHRFLAGAIQEADYLLVDATNPDFDTKLHRLQPNGQTLTSPLPFLYLPEYGRSPPGDVHWKSEIDRLRERNEFLVLYHGRQEWATYVNEFTGKNTHHLIHGFAAFRSRFPQARCKLVMLEYGTDVRASKDLVATLGIADEVVWLPTMYRKDIMYLISQCDVGSGEFGRSYVTFGTIIEAMSQGKPVLHHRDDSLYRHVYPELYPLFNCRQPDEIAAALASAYTNPAHTKSMGRQALAWVEQHLVQRPVSQIVRILCEKTQSQQTVRERTLPAAA
jgi:glycosyltransferase involved in cell wall biosynthesis